MSVRDDPKGLTAAYLSQDSVSIVRIKWIIAAYFDALDTDALAEAVRHELFPWVKPDSIDVAVRNTLIGLGLLPTGRPER